MMELKLTKIDKKWAKGIYFQENISKNEQKVI